MMTKNVTPSSAHPPVGRDSVEGTSGDETQDGTYRERLKQFNRHRAIQISSILFSLVASVPLAIVGLFCLPTPNELTYVLGFLFLWSVFYTAINKLVRRLFCYDPQTTSRRWLRSRER